MEHCSNIKKNAWCHVYSINKAKPMITGILLAILYVIKQPGSEKSIWLTHSPNMLNSESHIDFQRTQRFGTTH